MKDKLVNRQILHIGRKVLRSTNDSSARLSRGVLILLIIGMSFSAQAQVTWDGGGGDLNWDTNNNWNPNGVPGGTDDITIDCSCTVTYDVNGDLEIDGSLTIAAGTTLDMGGEKLVVGKNDNTATLTNNGTITNSAEIKSKGTGVYGDGPTLNNYGTMSLITKLSAGNNNGGGYVNNYATGVISGTDAHVDGQICNYGSITFTDEFLLHGGILCGDGDLDAGWIEIKPNPTAGAAGAGNGGEIQGGSLGDGSGCSDGADNSNLEYFVDGNGPYTFQEMLDLYGASSSDLELDPAGVSSCGEPAYITLPVELAFFNGYASRGEVVLEWATHTEKENDHYDIEWSQDGENFEVIGRVAGAGNSSDYLLYSFHDTRPRATLSYYRLAQVDFDGTTNYSGIVSVELWGSSFSTYPNPTVDRVTVRVPGGQSWQMTIYDMEGRSMRSMIFDGAAAEVNMQDLPRGQYVLKVTNGLISEQAVILKTE